MKTYGSNQICCEMFYTMEILQEFRKLAAVKNLESRLYIRKLIWL